MWDKSKPEGKWLMILVKLIVLVLVFKLGMFVGEAKVVHKMMFMKSGHPAVMQGHGGDYTGLKDHDWIKIKKMMGGDYDAAVAAKKEAAAEKDAATE